MKQRFHTRVACSFLATAMFASLGNPLTQFSQAAEDFSYLQISDSHVSPHPEEAGQLDGARSAEALRWVAGEAGKAQEQTPYKVTAPVPSFLFHTGDITEYGVIGQTYQDFLGYLQNLPVRLYVTPGNHDNTWTAMDAIMRKEYGGDCYSFDRFGCHFIAIDSASPQEPLPSLDRRIITWLERDLAQVDPQTPIFLFLHHPLYSREFASEYETLQLMDVFANHRLALIHVGHGHNASQGHFEHVPWVQGGSTFGKNTGYNVISVMDDVLRVAYRFKDQPMKGLLERPLSEVQTPRRFRIHLPQTLVDAGASRKTNILVDADARGPAIEKMRYDVDGNEQLGMPFEQHNGRWTTTLDPTPLTPGWHYVRIEAEDAKGQKYHRVAAFEVRRPNTGLEVQRFQNDAGFKATPLVLDDLVVAADTAGTVIGFDRNLRMQWRFQTGGEVLGQPAAADRLIIFGSGDGNIYALHANTGEEAWRYEAGVPVYASPVIRDGVAYLGDNEGQVHALRVQDGQKVWSQDPATFSIESSGTLMNDTLLVSAWDGLTYALGLEDGQTQWKAWCPTGQEGKKVRYYAAADCPPVTTGENLWITDRGYRLGLYKLDGSFVRQVAEQTSAIAPAEDGKAIYARTTGEALIKYDSEGEELWRQRVPLGRFPIQPTERDGKVFVCSNTGLATALNADDGQILWQYQTTPQLFVMAGVGAGADGSAYVGDMDGGLTLIRQR